MTITASGPIAAMYHVSKKILTHGGGIQYELDAVIPNYGEEDESPAMGFHRSTPSGKATLNYHIGRAVELEPDQRVLLVFTPIDDDAVPPDEGGWILRKRIEYEHSCVEFYLEPFGKDRPFSYRTEFDISVETDFTQADFGRPGQRFTLELRPVS